MSEPDERDENRAERDESGTTNPDLHGQAREVVEGASDAGPAPTPGGG